ncbi:uncharacterized protein BP5553_03479 [Venustampulla echinocandica]|uniref:LIM zinc-binding domain-containing protein n=1 Tax=Venustampulla echinocandica TaxID=2656787 RepID=A0A370TUE5_9HELO|nr:uncharacterized protein BP5553_03479 [Venustampulla echinocandica]RDL39139.1 hypothetical protein BP5553_03479 [Venustampulla echinocandica]
MADMNGASSFLPTIKCSMCARDIEISQMGDHVCSSSGEPTPPPDSYGSFDRMPYKQTPVNDQGFLKPGRAMRPKVDTSAANRPYFPQGQLTPQSATSSTGSPLDGRRSPFGRPLRNATAPLQRAPPSPGLLTSNLDCAFPPFPPKSPQPRSYKAAENGGMGNIYAEPDQIYAPVSPETGTNAGLLKRMNTIAPGPFDINNRRKPDDPTARRGHQRKGTGASLADMTMSSRSEDSGRSIARPGTAGSGHSRTSTNSSNGFKLGISAPKVPSKNGYGGFGPPLGSDDAFNQRSLFENRSQTFPLPNTSQDAPFRRPSEPGFGSQMRKPSGSGPDLTRPLPPRGVSLIKPRGDTQPGETPPMPENLDLAAEFGVGNPYHTPTESQSSDGSGYTQASKASSRSSPPRSTGPGRLRRQPSDTTQMDFLMSELQSSMTLQPDGPAPRPSPPKDNSIIVQQSARPLYPQNRNDIMLSPESPMDPTFQGERPSPSSLDNLAGTRLALPNKPREDRPRRATASKGNCKACGEPIKGKSVSSADGRLTGRYHKQCFVCTTCKEPFQTSTFYVIDDAPYCERHYHKLNGSMCTTCDRGIEGQYLETERQQKFHPRCLTCADCKRSLRHDYFEMDGRVYCERDAFRRAQKGRFLGAAASGSSRMERRTTRLMMM